METSPAQGMAVRAAHLVQDAGHQGVMIVGGQHGLQPVQALPQRAQQLLHPGALRLVGRIRLLAELVAGQPVQNGPARTALRGLETLNALHLLPFAVNMLCTHPLAAEASVVQAEGSAAEHMCME